MRRFQTICTCFCFAFLTLLLAALPFPARAQRQERSTFPTPSAHSRRLRPALEARFTPAQRAQIAGELAQNAVMAAQDANRAAPVRATRGTPAAARQQNHQTHLAILLNRKYDRQTCARYKITYDEMMRINREAIDNSLKRN